MMGRRAFTWVEVTVIIVVVAILAIITVPSFQRSQVRARIAAARADLRAVSVAVESYAVDNGHYPSSAMQRGPDTIDVPTSQGMATLAGATVDREALGDKPASWNKGRTFRLGRVIDPERGAVPSTLTTPVAYMTYYPTDAMADTPGMTFRYHGGRVGYLVGSFGIDRDEATAGDLPWEAPFEIHPTATEWQGQGVVVPPAAGTIEAILDARVPQPSPELLSGASAKSGKGAYTYDPTNGLISEGDLWQVGGYYSASTATGS